MMPKAKKAALCAAISLLLGSFSVSLFSGYASAASVASQQKAYAQSAAAGGASPGEDFSAGLDGQRPHAGRIGDARRTLRKCLNTHIDKTYGSC